MDCHHRTLASLHRAEPGPEAPCHGRAAAETRGTEYPAAGNDPAHSDRRTERLVQLERAAADLDHATECGGVRVRLFEYPQLEDSRYWYVMDDVASKCVVVAGLGCGSRIGATFGPVVEM